MTSANVLSILFVCFLVAMGILLFAILLNKIGLPLEIERKFLLKNFDQDVFAATGIDYTTAEIEQVYLTPQKPGTVLRVRKHTLHNVTTYWKTQKEHVSSGVNIEIENEISKKEYDDSCMNHKEPGTTPVVKKRLCFSYQNQLFELDVFDWRHKGLCVLEIELSDRDQNVILPPFLEIEREVTDESAFSNRSLAQINN